MAIPPAAAAADLIVHRANVVTLDDRGSRASSLVVHGDRISYVGDDATALLYRGPNTQVIDAGGKTVTPGFCDAHVHFAAFGHMRLRYADLVGCGSVDEVLERLAELAARTSGWVMGHGFDQDKLRERRCPTRAELDRVSRDRPIHISRVCGHAVVVNSAALSLATPAERAAGDEVNGYYTETAGEAFLQYVPPPDAGEWEGAVLAAADVALRTGITSLHTLLDTPAQMAGYSRLAAKGKLPLRVTGMPPYSAVAALSAHGIRTGFGDDMLRFGAAKLFSDGSLGARTAWLAEPYADDPTTRGLRIYDPEDLKAMAADAQAKGFQLAIHAIGDQAMRETLDAIEHALGPNGDNAVHRHRIEHCSLTPPDCLERMAARKVVGILQPQFVRSDAWTPDRIGPAREAWAYPFRSLLAAGVPIALSSDAPVERLDAFACLSAAVGRCEWSPDETLTPTEALTAYCRGGAYAAHRERVVGSLEVGKYADFVILSDDPTNLGAYGIGELRAERVLVGGRSASVAGSPTL